MAQATVLSPLSTRRVLRSGTNRCLRARLSDVDDVVTWATFFVSAAAIVIASSFLAKQGNAIAEETGIGGIWIGVILLATATSLPEVVTNVSAAAIDEADLAVGNLFGSSMANMAILAAVDLMHRQRRVWQTVSLGQTLVASLSIALTSITAMFIVSQLGWTVFHIGIDTLVVGALYILGTRVVFRHEYLEALAHIADRASTGKTNPGDEPEKLRFPARRTTLGFLITAAVILATGPFLADSAAGISDMTGIEKSFVGATFLAITTSLPELITAVAAVRIGAHDLAVGNLFGSNAFNMLTLVFADIAYTPGAILNDVSSAQVIAATAALLMMALAAMGIVYRAERRYTLVEPDAALVLVTYVIGLALVYEAGA